MSNVRNVQFLRNGSLYESREAATSALQSNALLSGLTDGSVVLARYRGDSATDVKTLVGYVYSNGTSKSVTIFDTESSGADVDEKIKEINDKLGDGITSANTVESQLEVLSGTSSDNSGDTSVWGAKAYAKDYADELKSNLDYTGVTADENKVVYNVTETDGIASAHTKNISSVKLEGYAEGSDSKIAATDTLGQALGKLQGQINAMDLSVVSGNGEVITAVSEADGKVSASKTALKDIVLTGYQKSSSTGDVASTDDVEDALSKLENNIAAIKAANTLSAADKSVNVVTAATGTTVALNIRNGEKVLKLDSDATSGGVYTDLDLVKITPGLPATIKERYQLLDSDDTQIGTNIDIPKDSHIVSITYITDTGDTHYQNLEYVYIDASGNTQTTYVDMSELVIEAEFASGVTAIDHIVRGVVDTTSEKDSQTPAVDFLTVGAGGFKVSGIKDEIDRKIAALDADVSGNSTHVTVGVAEVDGKITAVTVSESNVANASDLSVLSAKTLTEVNSSNNSVSATVTSATDGTVSVDLVTDASKIKMTGFTADTSGFTGISESSSVTDAVKEIETAFLDNEEVVSGALNDINGRIEELSGNTITAVTSNNNSISASISDNVGNKTINVETDASKISGLTAVADVSGEISGVSASDSVQTGIKNLYASLAAEIAARKAAISATSVVGSDAIDVAQSDSGDTVSLVLDGTSSGTGSEKTGTDNALTINSNGLFLSTNWDCGTYENS